MLFIVTRRRSTSCGNFDLVENYLKQNIYSECHPFAKSTRVGGFIYLFYTYNITKSKQKNYTYSYLKHYCIHFILILIYRWITQIHFTVYFKNLDVCARHIKFLARLPPGGQNKSTPPVCLFMPWAGSTHLDRLGLIFCFWILKLFS